MNKSTIGTAKKGFLALLLCTLFLFACKKNRSEQKMLEIKNETGVALILVNAQNGERSPIGLAEVRQIATTWKSVYSL